NGTINDLAVGGARPVAIAAAFVLEEGLDASILRREVETMASAARRAGVRVVTGDTKVVERGKADGMYIVTTGIGVRHTSFTPDTGSVRPGDKIVCSGAIGAHGTAIMLARGELELDADVVSDTAPLWLLARAVMDAAGDGLRVMRDPTRGGLATVLNEIAADAGIGAIVEEDAIPVLPAVRGACEILGIDPMYVANEGKLVAVADPSRTEDVLSAMKEAGEVEAAIIGEIAEDPPGMVLVKTGFGGTRIMDMMIGDPLPRIC
ncbi:MAG: hydrogenase expression/formation protein HypE, partial [Actinomycetota bacterium]